MPTERQSQQNCFSLSAVVSDVLDGATRFLTDFAKIGLQVREMHVVDDPEGEARLDMRLAAPEGMDMGNLASRLQRHVCVLSLSLA
jgi:hypothetical protein